MKLYKNTAIPFLTIFLILINLLGCAEKTQQSYIYDDPETIALQKQSQELQDLIKNKTFLKAATDRDRRNILSNLSQIDANLALLARDHFNEKALYNLQSSLSLIQSSFLSEKDRQQLHGYIKRSAQKMAAYAEGMNIDLSLSLPLYQYRFSMGLHEFTQFSRHGQWVTQLVQSERYAVKVNAPSFDTTLVSPIFDFTHIKNPMLKIRHQLSLPHGEKNIEELFNEGFKVKVSTDFKPYKNFKEATWQELPLEMPSGQDFHVIDTTPLSLAQYEGEKNVTIAFFANAKSSASYKYMTWAIERFEIRGYSDRDLTHQKWKDPNPEIYRLSFDNIEVINKLTPFNIYDPSLGENPQNIQPILFDYGTAGGKKYLKIQARKPQDGITSYKGSFFLVIDDVIDLTKASDAKVKMLQAINFYNGNDKVSDHSLVVAQHREGLPVDQLDWHPLYFEKYPPENGWTFYQTEERLLPEAYQGQKIRIGLRYSVNAENSRPAWEIGSLSIRVHIENK